MVRSVMPRVNKYGCFNITHRCLHLLEAAVRPRSLCKGFWVPGLQLYRTVE